MQKYIHVDPMFMRQFYIHHAYDTYTNMESAMDTRFATINITELVRLSFVVSNKI